MGTTPQRSLWQPVVHARVQPMISDSVDRALILLPTFDHEALRCTALGLVAVEERAAARGGQLHVSSSPGMGTTVRLECPIRCE